MDKRRDNAAADQEKSSGRTGFIRNSETGIVEAWRDGKKVCDMYGMGDFIRKTDDGADAE